MAKLKHFSLTLSQFHIIFWEEEATVQSSSNLLTCVSQSGEHGESCSRYMERAAVVMERAAVIMERAAVTVWEELQLILPKHPQSSKKKTCTLVYWTAALMFSPLE